MNLLAIFLAGLTVGGIGCVAVQGGLLATVIATKEEEVGNARKFVLYATAAFLISKLVVHAALGFVLGVFGASINLDGNLQIFMQLVAGVYMLVVAFNFLELHPIFRYAIFSPPKFLVKLLRKQSKSANYFSPILLGAMTVFIPCGTTLAMEVLAISSTSGLAGMATMTAFILGTFPIFFAIGLITSIMGEAFKEKFLKIASVVIIYLALTSINGALIALGSPIFIANPFNNSQVAKNGADSVVATASKITINVTGYGYSPSYFRVKKGEEITVSVVAKEAYSCASAFRVPQLGVARNLGPNETYVFKFTPQEAGQITFTCSMGMYRGIIEVI